MAIQLQPKEPKYYHAKGLSYESQALKIEERLRHYKNGGPTLLLSEKGDHDEETKEDTIDAQIRELKESSRDIEREEEPDKDEIFYLISPILQQSIVCYKAAIDRDEKFVESRFHAALIMKKIYNFRNALEYLTIVLQEKPQQKQVWVQRGLV